MPVPGISYTWRSILKGVDTLKLGIIWHVGDGKSINIWEDPWLPRNNTRRPMTPRMDCELQKVSDLLEPFCGGWNVDLIRQHLWEEDVDLILKIPVHLAFNDTIAWHPDAKGLFSVKSAYHISVINEDEKNNRGELPNKIKHFLWRLAHNSVAVRTNLRRRGMDVETNCLMMRSKPLWQTILWNWWLERNKVREGGPVRPTDELVFIIKNQTKAFLEAYNSLAETCGNWVKINCDGSFLENTGSGGWGAVLRDSCGSVLACGAGNLPCLLNPFQAEARAANQGIILAASKGLPL
ncbi:hypothetical protein BRADI_2g37573v3 [Brachypodium distachyon]|uniref:RNase H type-1 domain-containing protein n=1 Tax=Brachypodium distachyon TaxID=15368 RepID=A0A0Q3G8I8_BRADI|nr:hypothetical protein BRADI_2g37573v3 [Brachypodium distachyon]